MFASLLSSLKRSTEPRRASRPTTRDRAGRSPRFVPHVEALEDRTVPSTLIPVANHRDMIYDAAHNTLDITTSNGTLQVFNLAVQSLQQPLVIGVNLAGADISADGTSLLVADQGITGQQVLHRINLQTLQLYNLNFPQYQSGSAAWDLALGGGTKGKCHDESPIRIL